MQNKRKPRQFNWQSLFSLIIFALVIGGRFIVPLLRNLFGPGSTTALNLLNLLPIGVGILVALSIVVAVVRALSGGGRTAGDVRLPTGAAPPRMPNTPLPPFGGPQRLPTLPTSALPRRAEGGLPQPPRFEPLISPAVLVIGILGLILLGGAALVVLAAGLP